MADKQNTKKTCKSCVWFVMIPDPVYHTGVCCETRFVMDWNAPSCNYYLYDGGLMESKTEDFNEI